MGTLSIVVSVIGLGILAPGCCSKCAVLEVWMTESRSNRVADRRGRIPADWGFWLGLLRLGAHRLRRNLRVDVLQGYRRKDDCPRLGPIILRHIRFDRGLDDPTHRSNRDEHIQSRPRYERPLRWRAVYVFMRSLPNRFDPSGPAKRWCCPSGTESSNRCRDGRHVGSWRSSSPLSLSKCHADS